MRSRLGLALTAALLVSAAVRSEGAPISEPGLAGRTDILYFEDFETSSHGGVVTEDPKLVKFGRRSSKVMYKGGGHGVEGKPKNSPRFKKINQVFVRRYIMFAADFDFAAGGKIDGSVCFAPGKRWQAGFGGKPSHGNDGFSSRLCWGRGGVMTMYTYHADMRGKYGSDFRGRSRFKPGTWQCVELMIKINTIDEGATKGNHDGEVRLWVDGVMDGEKKGLRFRDLPTMAIDNWSYGYYFGGLWTCPKDQYIYMDNVVVARSYIGPAVFKRPEPKKSSVVVFKPKEKSDPLGGFKEALAPVREKAKAGDYAGALAECEKIVASSEGQEGAAALAAYRDGLKAAAKLKKLVIAGAAEKKPTVYVDFAGRPMRMKLTGADDSGCEFRMSGTGMPLKWRQLGPNRFYGIASKFVEETSEGHLKLGQYCATMGLKDDAEKELEKAAASPALHAKIEAARSLIAR